MSLLDGILALLALGGVLTLPALVLLTRRNTALTERLGWTSRALRTSETLRDDADLDRGRLTRELTEAQAGSPLTAEQRETIRTLLTVQPGRCNHCGGVHQIACPRVRRERFAADGQTLLDVEYWAVWPTENILFIEDVT